MPDQMVPFASFGLKAYRVALRKPRVDVNATGIAVRFPSYFGSRLWTFPHGQTAVARVMPPSAASAGEDRLPLPELPLTMFAVPPVVPFLSATSDLVKPTIVLLFREPQTVPPTRWWTCFGGFKWGPLETRRSNGPRVDGLLLRPNDADAALTSLEAFGVERTEHPDVWLAEHRQQITDRAAIAHRTEVGGRLHRWVRASQTLVITGCLTVGAARLPWLSGTAGLVIAITGAVLILVGLVAQRRAAGTASRRLEGGQPTPAA